MLKKCLFFFCLLSLAALAGCSSATKFSHFQIEETDTALVATGEVSLQGEDGVLLTIQALEPFSTTLHLTYSKEAGDVTVALGDAQQASLESGAVEDTTADIPVSGGLYRRFGCFGFLPGGEFWHREHPLVSINSLT